MDETVNREQAQKFEQIVNGILRCMAIDDDKSNIVTTLTKIESKIHYLAEARNYLHFKDKQISQHQRV